MPLLLKRRDGKFWTGKVGTPEEWTESENAALRFDDSERYAIRHNNTLWKTVDK